MSKASTTRTIKFIAKAGTYTALIMCPDGDIYQEWEGTESDVTKVFPNFEQTKPKLNFVCMSSRVAEGVATPDSMQYFFNGTKIEFNGDTSSGIFGLYRYCPWMRGMATSQISCNNGIDKKASHVPL